MQRSLEVSSGRMSTAPPNPSLKVVKGLLVLFLALGCLYGQLIRGFLFLFF